MTIDRQLPSYEELFEALDFKKGEEARSVYSPAAYLADLVQLLEDYFSTSLEQDDSNATNPQPDDINLNLRRPDIKDIVLDGENTYDLLPYLDIVNNLLRRLVEMRTDQDAFEILKKRDYPFNLPLNFDFEKLKKFLRFLEVTQVDIEDVFSSSINSAVRAPYSLGLSPEETNYILKDRDDVSEIKRAYDLDNSDNLIELLADVSTFLRKTGLKGIELRELLSQDLSAIATTKNGNSETDLANEFFANEELKGFVALDDSEEKLVWRVDNQNKDEIPLAWFDKADRLIRLARRTNFSFSELSLILRLCAHNRLNYSTLQILAFIQQMQSKYDLAVDMVVSLLSVMNTVGLGNENEPLALFDRIFNQRFAELDGNYLIHSDYHHPIYDGLDIMIYDDAPLLDVENIERHNKNAELRQRIQKTLKISERDLKLIFERCIDHAEETGTYSSIFTEAIGLETLSFLFRVVLLVDIFDISYSDLFNILDVIDNDPAIRSSNPFGIFLPLNSGLNDSFRILEKPDANPMEALWLIQMIEALTGWMRNHDLAPLDIKFIQMGVYSTSEEMEAAKLFTDTLFTQVIGAFLPFNFNKDSFASDTLDVRTSHILHESIVAFTTDIVSQRDARILRAKPTIDPDAMHKVVRQLGVLSPLDFKAIGLSEPLNDKLYQHLVLHGYLDTSGILQIEHFPETVEDFMPISDFSAFHSTVFNIMKRLYQEADEGRINKSVSADIEMFLYPSDISDLDMSHEQLQELYDNLIFNHVIDEEGRVITPAFFMDDEFSEELRVNLELSEVHIAQLYNFLQTRLEAYKQSAYAFNENIFEGMGLPDYDLADLIQNLEFNDYIDSEKMYYDKETLVDLSISDFKITLKFYPLRHQILTAIQADLAENRRQYFTITKEDLTQVSDAVVGDWCFERVQETYLYDNRIDFEWLDYFLDAEKKAEFQLGHYFSPDFDDTVFDRIQSIQIESERYLLKDIQLIDIGLSFDDANILFERLVSEGYIDAYGYILPMHNAFFLNIENAIVFNLVGYEDFNKDLFFVLNSITSAVAELRATVNETLSLLATSQERAVVSTLAEGLEIDVDSLRIIADNMLYHPENRVEALLNPILPDMGLEMQSPSKSYERTFRQMLQFIHLALILKLDVNDIDIVFRDQNLVEKFPEPLALPDDIHEFDVIFAGLDDKVYMFRGSMFWTYDAETGMLDGGAQPLATMSPLFASLDKVDATFIDPDGHAWLISGTQYFKLMKESEKWQPVRRRWGLIDTNFSNPKQIDAGFVTPEGVTYLFSGEQYIRYSGDDFTSVDAGYPRKISGNWTQELETDMLPIAFRNSIDAGFATPDGTFYLFKDDKFVHVDGNHISEEQPLVPFWGRVDNNFDELITLDAGFTDQGYTYLFLDDQVTRYSDHPENYDVSMDEGFPLRLNTWFSNLPDEFEFGVDAIFRGADGHFHLFKNNHTIEYTSKSNKRGDVVALTDKWGLVDNTLQETGQVDAAFTGLDGCTYLFSGEQYVRYSGRNFSHVDEGYPRTIATDWGGLETIGAAFILDGRTYLFDLKSGISVAYSTNDYSIPDEGFPQKIDQEEWWNLPKRLINEGFAKPDAIFIDQAQNTYLFKGQQFVTFDHVERWWSEPKPIGSKFNNLPETLSKIDAAFTGKDGRTYVFSGKRFWRYSDADFNQLDDRYPRNTKVQWGLVLNQIQRNRRIDSAVMLDSHEIVFDESGNEVEQQVKHTYLFSGTQYVRYTGDDYDFVDEGYPRTIRTSLHLEPRFKNLSKPLTTRIDAVFADQRQVYLVLRDMLHVIAEDAYRVYDDALTTIPSAVMTDEGSVYFATTNGWTRNNHTEIGVRHTQAELPSSLREIPPIFHDNINAVLVGTDGNTYLFRDADCFNLQLNKGYPTREEWGVVKNSIAQQRRVDSAFVGLDGNTYMFSGDQFIVYTNEVAADIAVSDARGFIEGLPEPIAEHWGGLNHVHLAFVRDGITHLMEKPDGHGNFRYITYSTADYTKPDNPEPMMGTFEFWDIPLAYQNEGFERVDAVLNDEKNLFLIQGRDFLQYNYEENTWTYAKPVDRVWRGLNFESPDFATVTTAFAADDERVVFFSDDSFVTVIHDVDNPLPQSNLEPIRSIDEHWGLVHNTFNESSTVDAAFVWDNQITYLFSGNQYIRYSTSDYRFVDDGYPKNIVESLRTEDIFQNLGDTFEDDLYNLAEDQQKVTAAFANKGTIYLVIANRVYAISVTTERVHPLTALGQMRNRIVQHNKIDAAVTSSVGEILLFADDQVFMYSDMSFDYVVEGYPRKISDFLASVESVETIPQSFTYNLDAALLKPNDGPIVLFKDSNYIDLGQDTSPKPVTSVWGHIHNHFMSDDENANIEIDAAFIGTDGHTYIFKNDQYLRYTDFNAEFVDEGYPRLIKDDWGNIPPYFEQGIDGGFVFDGKTYLLKKQYGEDEYLAEYVRYSRPNYQTVDNIYPQPIVDRWRTMSDYSLRDLRLISVLKRIQAQTGGLGDILSASFSGAAGDVANPYLMLNEIFGWDVTEIRWVKKHNAFLSGQDRLEQRFNLELIEKMYNIFTLAHKMGASPSDIYENVWMAIYATPTPDFLGASEALYRYLGSKNSQSDWEILKQQIHDELNILKRDVWIPLVIALYPMFERPNDLFEHLLIDVEMGSAAKTSHVKEAISAVQLYFHRYLINLENIQLDGSDRMTREQFKQRWQWLKNYRMWEANRKVFLYPENYLRPELRDTKTPEFESLEEALLQGTLDMQTAESAYTAYLESFSQVGNLKITGANLYPEGDDKVLILFGHTRLEPREYYYRLATFSPKPKADIFDSQEMEVVDEGSVVQDELVVWQPWQKVDVPIKSDRVFPIRSNGRLMVFWIEIEDREEPEAKFKSQSSDNENDDADMVSEVNTGAKQMRHDAYIKFSVLKYNKHWTPPQRIKDKIELTYEIDAAYAEGEHITTFAGAYCLRTTDDNPDGEIKRIEEVTEFNGLPTSFKQGIDAATILGQERYFFKGNQCYIEPINGGAGRMVSMRSLIKLPQNTQLLIIAPGIFSIGFRSLTWTVENPADSKMEKLLQQGADAAFVIGNNIMSLVDKDGNYSFYLKEGNQLAPIRDMDAILGIYVYFPIIISTLVNRGGNFRPADAVFKQNGFFYILRDGQYEVYDDVGTELIPLDGFPKPIRGNLSFNMDKFFNKLHLDPDGDRINIVYKSPKDELMLYGELKPDFTFKEIQRERDRALTIALNWSGSDNSRPYTYYVADDQNIATSPNTFASGLANIAAEIDKRNSVITTRDEFKTAIEAAWALAGKQEEQSEDEENQRETFKKRKSNVTTPLDNIETRLQQLAAHGIYDPMANSVMSYINALRGVVNQFPDSNGRGLAKKQLRDDLEAILVGSSDSQTIDFQALFGLELMNNLMTIDWTQVGSERITELFNTAIREARNAIKNDIDNTRENIEAFVAKNMRTDYKRHIDVSDRYYTFVNTMGSNAEILITRLLEQDLADDNREQLEKQRVENTKLINEARSINYADISKTILENGLDANSALNSITKSSSLSDDMIFLQTAASHLNSIPPLAQDRSKVLGKINKARTDLQAVVAKLVKEIKETLLGEFDLFPSDFRIANTSNFAFSEPSEPDWYVFESMDGTFLCKPMTSDESGRYEIIRLTSLVVPRLSSILFAQGMSGFLTYSTQEEDEIPKFGSRRGEIRYNSARLQEPTETHLDYTGASSIYYAELFFHAPLLIAQALNADQQFSEAQIWYEYIFDPTYDPQVSDTNSPWLYLPFRQQQRADNVTKKNNPSEDFDDFLVDYNQIKRYLDDPFDPHAIAALRPRAYRKAVVMSYIDNLLDWGDMLFRQYSIESINEARMLYTLANDLLGDKPASLGTMVLSPDQPLKALANEKRNQDVYEFLIETGHDSPNLLLEKTRNLMILRGTPHESVAGGYFFVPENGLITEYWNRVEDRLYKIRQSLNIDGEAQPLPLFQPPLDPMAIVQAVARGISLSQIVGGSAVPVPHYRFEFLAFRAQNLVQKVNQYGMELLATIEKKDAEALSLMQTRQEGQIMELMIDVREAQIKENEQTILNLEESLRFAQERINLYGGWLDVGMLPQEQHQINLMIASSVFHYAGSLLKLGAMIASFVPDAMVGPFIMGIKTGGTNIGEGLSSGAEVAQNVGEGLSITGELMGIKAQIEHMFEDWDVQLRTAKSEEKQITYQIEAARIQKMIAEYELAVLHKEIEHNRSIQTFMTDKFSNEQLYQWMIGKMSGLYYQTYQMALDMARLAEKAYQFERGIPESEVSFIQGGYWDSQRKGLLAGEQLTLDLDRMEQAFINSNERRLEITKEISILELDPLAFMRLKMYGVCEFALDEAFYDYDFPGHYARQIKTISVEFNVPEGVTANATLTQLSHQTVMKPDPKAVKFLLDPKDQPPTTIRSDWRANQQVVLSHHDQYEKNNGMFELRYDTDNYLPFEGTGAVSRWQLALNGKKGSLDLRSLLDIKIQIRYTARRGGRVFQDVVKGMLRPYQTARFFDLIYDFSQEWNDFLDDETNELVLTFKRDQFPNMSSSKITGIFARFDVDDGQPSLILNNTSDWELRDNAYTDTSGLSIGREGTDLRFALRGDKASLRNVQLIFGYRADIS